MALIRLTEDMIKGRLNPVRVFGSSNLILCNEDVYMEIEIGASKPSKGKAYIIGDYVYPYTGLEYDSKTSKPGIYKIADEFHILEPSKKTKDEYDTTNITQLDLDSIVDDILTNIDNFTNDEDLEYINSNKTKYVPTINKGDDVLKRLIKTVILEKDVDINIFRPMFDKEHQLDNLKNILTSATPMTVKRFNQWCELLGIGYKVTVFNDISTGSKSIPLKHNIEESL